MAPTPDPVIVPGKFNANKFIAALLTSLVGAVSEAIDLGVFHGTARTVVGIAIPFVTTALASAGVYIVPNKPVA